MDSLHTEIASLKATLTDPGFYTRDAKGFNATATRLSEKEARLLAAEEEWLQLEMKREELRG